MTITLQPSANAPLDRDCDMCKQRLVRDPAHIVKKAVADAKLIFGPWAYVCIEHLEISGTLNSQLINNITDTPLELPWLSS